MALKEYPNLTDDEVKRGELMSLRLMLAVILHHMLVEHPNPELVYKEIGSAVTQFLRIFAYKRYRRNAKRLSES